MSQPEPTEQPIRARVPDHVSSGAFSTGVIVMTANSEFVLDFVQNLGRPHQIVARVVMPHYVLPQLVDALQRNIEIYRGRWGELPTTSMPPVSQVPWHPGQNTGAASPGINAGAEGTQGPSAGGSGGSGAPLQEQSELANQAHNTPPPGSASRQASAQDIYDDLKIRDELLSGAYANAVMIGHGAHEFSFDFITNFYPHSSVSARVFLAAGQVPRLLDSLKSTWEQLKSRTQGGRGQNPPPAPPEDGPGPIA